MGLDQGIPVVVVDDDQVDRYTVRRRLQKHGGFADAGEACSGDAFLTTYCNGKPVSAANGLPLLILIDQNMPGRNGFETIAELEARQKEGLAPPSVVVFFVSSTDQLGMSRAAATPMIRGCIEKPLDDVGAQTLFETYQRCRGDYDAVD